MRHPGQQRRQMSSHVGVPGVRVDQVRASAVAHHGQVHAQRADGHVRGRELRQIDVPGGVHLVAFSAEAADLDIDVPTVAQRSHELSHVDARATVDLWRVLLAQDVDSHIVNASPAAGSSRDHSSLRLSPWLSGRGPPRC